LSQEWKFKASDGQIQKKITNLKVKIYKMLPNRLSNHPKLLNSQDIVEISN